MSLSSRLSSPLRTSLWAGFVFYLVVWAAHLYTGTLALRGFFGDGALAFLVYLSDSYALGQSGSWVHLFPVGFPRDFQMLLNALGLQAALGLDIRNPAALKYIFNFWQFALPGFLYLGLFAVLWRKGYAQWIIFPLISWAVLSAPVDWTAPNSTRWAIPILWMHFMLVILSGPRIRLWPSVAAMFFGIAMLGGLYESVTLHCALCLGFGVLFWIFRNNRAPFLYALASIPGAIRAALTYIASGHDAPNKVSQMILPLYVFHSWYFGLIGAALALIAVFATGKIPLRYAGIGLFALLVLVPAINLLIDGFPSPWAQIGMRFDYVVISLILMIWAGTLRLFNKDPAMIAPPIAFACFLAGSALWASQIEGTLNWWQPCRAARDNDLQAQTLDIGPAFRPLYAVSDRDVSTLPARACQWDWAEPWTQLLLAKDGEVDNWAILTFWQDFSFIKKDGAVYLHTNNWTLNAPAMQESEGNLPLRTLLYDLTPLYKKLGDGPLAVRQTCFPAEKADHYWRQSLLNMDDAKRAAMFVCPKNE